MATKSFIRVRTLITSFCGLTMFFASASPAQATDDAKAIMEEVFDRKLPHTLSGTLQILTKDHANRERRRTMRVINRRFEASTKTLMQFESPTDVRNTGLLSVDYDSGDKTDDQWLYLPSLKKATRISTRQRSGSFMGTDFTYADMTRSDPNHFDYKMLDANASVDGEPCWKIEARPKTEKAKSETGYLKTEAWISKSKKFVLQVKAWVIRGKRLKQIKFSDIEAKGKSFVAKKLFARTLKGKKVESTTVMTYTNLKLDDPSILESSFQIQVLERGL
ncbi:MAG: outer membrane lipoprotein-sorting protein [Myxococcota bacterium]|nr:outer membrane lipoprotein-sorting protein [Myxococcota bacterium]